jgi:hypothetical protein
MPRDLTQQRSGTQRSLIGAAHNIEERQIEESFLDHWSVACRRIDKCVPQQQSGAECVPQTQSATVGEDITLAGCEIGQFAKGGAIGDVLF